MKKFFVLAPFAISAVFLVAGCAKEKPLRPAHPQPVHPRLMHWLLVGPETRIPRGLSQFPHDDLLILVGLDAPLHHYRYQIRLQRRSESGDGSWREVWQSPNNLLPEDGNVFAVWWPMAMEGGVYRFQVYGYGRDLADPGEEVMTTSRFRQREPWWPQQEP